jgi:hypothetical protein
MNLNKDRLRTAYDEVVAKIDAKLTAPEWHALQADAAAGF